MKTFNFEYKGKVSTVEARDTYSAANKAMPPPKGWSWHMVGTFHGVDEVGDNQVATLSVVGKADSVARFVLYDNG